MGEPFGPASSPLQLQTRSHQSYRPKRRTAEARPAPRPCVKSESNCNANRRSAANANRDSHFSARETAYVVHAAPVPGLASNGVRPRVNSATGCACQFACRRRPRTSLRGEHRDHGSSSHVVDVVKQTLSLGYLSAIGRWRGLVITKLQKLNSKRRNHKLTTAVMSHGRATPPSCNCW
ncbi:hypothetical protein MPTK1_8g16930 [Marchantia polymorpha subsp. ruderalis]|uniref:Uncharacterized protein n=1 Tax=Marchantia polymorpha TaxID=3197 RepID=A0A2R6X846_MARPO|nr:hypothetical protein MARPO_0030s0023 [Marchantia polymorpha]PTQ42281.1 hypothetical protein MARPO_0030s0027 [Marchantia polymorpha]BBN20166.1 hypothetical protein Mp_8g16930 [Marchantia polymorpha subsp. ruderalis]|eukprot:PTQ42275.1 hypothetical protein MARPO_0030s0023 [Marchantia polymorpha]